MLSIQFIRSAQLRATTRCFTRSTIVREINKDEISAQKRSNPANPSGVIGSRMYRVTNFDKKVLVWVKRYPSIADVPIDVTTDCILTARNKARIKACNYMIVFSIIGCIIYAIMGKKQAARGENLSKQRNDWLREKLAEEKNK